VSRYPLVPMNDAARELRDLIRPTWDTIRASLQRSAPKQWTVEPTPMARAA
jgi:hypothetical protein